MSTAHSEILKQPSNLSTTNNSEASTLTKKQRKALAEKNLEDQQKNK